MNSIPETSLWLIMILRSSWLLWVLPLGLTLCLAVFLRPRRGSPSAVARAISRAIQAQGIPLFRGARSDFARELSRARRYEHPLTIVVIKMEYVFERVRVEGRTNGASSGGKLPLEHYTFPLTGVILKDALRESDIVSYDVTNNRFILLLAETTKAQASLATERLLRLISARLLATFIVGLAEFPADGVTIEALVHEAEAAIRS